MKETSHFQASILHRVVTISLLKCSFICFINRNRSALVRNTTIDFFGGSLDAVADIVDEVESNPYAFADSSDTE